MKKIFPKMKKYKKIVLNDFSNWAWKDENLTRTFTSTMSYNVNSCTKIIKGGLGISQAKVPRTASIGSPEVLLNTANLAVTNINKLLYFRQYFTTSGNTQDRILLHGSDNKLYVHQMHCNSGVLMWLYELTFSSPPICLTYKLNGNDSIILSSPEKMVVWTTNLSPYIVEDVPIITSMCISNNVLFCTIAEEANKIWYCLSLNPELIGTTTDYTKFFSLDDERGYARKILTFKENLYVFRDYGITKINYYSASSITTNQVYLSDSRIIADTVTVCGDVVLFLTRDGIYSFNGVTVKKETIGIEKFMGGDNSHALGSSMQDKYYLALKLNFNDDENILCESETYKNNALCVINLKDFSFELIRGVDIKSMLPLKTNTVEKMLATFNSGEIAKVGEIDNSGKYFDVNLPKYYSTSSVFNDDNHPMVIRKISIIASPDVNIKLTTSNQSYEFVTTIDGLNEFQTIINCRDFKVEFSSSASECKIKHLEIEYFKQ